MIEKKLKKSFMKQNKKNLSDEEKKKFYDKLVKIANKQ